MNEGSKKCSIGLLKNANISNINYNFSTINPTDLKYNLKLPNTYTYVF